MKTVVVPETPVERRLPAPVWWVVLSGTLLLVAFAGYTVWAGVWTATGVYLEDFRSYVATGAAVRAGMPLYEPGVSHLPTIGGTFKYTPFAAGVFVPLTVLPKLLLPLFAVLVNLFSLLAVVWVSLGQLGYARDHGRVAATAALAALALPMQPVLINFTTGQVNLVLLLLVVLDLTGRNRWWTGAGVGLAAGIKLTPAIFVVYLLVTRRFRAAGMAVATFGATVLAGFAVLPHDSAMFWSANLADPSRITGDNDAMSPQNQSIRGALARLLSVPDVPGRIWIPVAAVVALAALWIAVRAHRRNRELLALSVVGALMVLVTPWTWTHYWVWFIPFFVMAACGALRSRTWWPALLVVLAYLLLFPWKVGTGRADVPVVGLVILPENHSPLTLALAHALYVVLALVLLVLAALRPAWLDGGKETMAELTGRNSAEAEQLRRMRD
ncbi:glycosyltransferase 87 family protein [Amycolatopsis sp., V23-08]|uniref:Glycosyltransferase 87 family protein n=1 Tax=Amycolatopsis heterodermiae TaxID=3110235 RepID=A0ABU5QZL1_9PSEU|nr:glycosyltransferase 87 family protein [Amycolatopsis sp., V23-08]MEA5359368.1 glycosyltransferase 87 family protein [Amycolatopsis sp., V23-08]